LQLPSRENLERFENAVIDWPEVVDCATVTGAVDYMLRIITKDMHAYDDFLRDKMLGLGLVSDVQSRIVMRAAKRTTAAPLELISSEHLEELVRAAAPPRATCLRRYAARHAICGFDGGDRSRCSRSH
jgi:DNA-binding Lrp family transcriptional regulator